MNLVMVWMNKPTNKQVHVDTCQMQDKQTETKLQMRENWLNQITGLRIHFCLGLPSSHALLSNLKSYGRMYV